MRLFVGSAGWLLGLAGICCGCQPPAEQTPPPATPVTAGETAGETADQPPSAAAAAAADSDQPQVQLALADLEQLAGHIAARAGKVVVVDIWSTSCAPCLREFPHLVELSRRYPDEVACISLNVDYIGLNSKPPESYLPPVEEFLQKQQAELLNLLSTATDETVLGVFKLEAIPAILIYDRQGKLMFTLTDVNAGEDGLTYAGDVVPRVAELAAAGK